jgi:hypothetical protein
LDKFIKIDNYSKSNVSDDYSAIGNRSHRRNSRILDLLPYSRDFAAIIVSYFGGNQFAARFLVCSIDVSVTAVNYRRNLHINLEKGSPSPKSGSIVNCEDFGLVILRINKIQLSIIAEYDLHGMKNTSLTSN